MARKKPTARIEFVLFDVVYSDGSQTSNRKVPAKILGGYEGDAPAKAEIERQDGEIAERSGKPRPPIKSIARVKKKKIAKVS